MLIRLKLSPSGSYFEPSFSYKMLHFFVRIMHVSFVQLCSLQGLENSGDIDISLSKAQVYHARYYDQVPPQSPAQTLTGKCKFSWSIWGAEK